MSLSAGIILATLASVLVAAFVQGVTGFGFGMVAMALLPLFTGAKSSSVLIGLLSLVTTSCVLYSVRRSFRGRDFLFPVVGMFAGVPFGVYALVMLDENLIQRLVGIAILIACAQMVIPSLRMRRAIPWPWALGAGFTSGILGGAFGIGGPPVIAYASMQEWEGARYKAMLCSFFATSNLYRVIIMAGAGLITGDILLRFAVASPALLLGVFLGIRAFGRLSRDAFRRVVLVTLLVLALTLLVL